MEFPSLPSTSARKQELKTKLIKVFERCNLTYINGGKVSDVSSAPSKSLLEVIKGRDIPSIEAEFNRALNNVNSAPRDAVSTACNILKSIFKVYIEDKKLPFPQKQDLQGVWKVVRDDLGFDTKLVQDDDLKRIISGMLSIVGGIGAFRTHASSAHGEGRKVYNLKPRHARLAIHSAHTLALFVLETWDEKKSKKPKSV
ncbi:ATP-dependent RNA helicase HrpA (plasmid) [Pseudoalteromonas lipolytica]|uniref:ATP-dependent RNA helicase HrpA n=1 Tax=Pseudoalteromonas lipolytica TaxID=570156 RepID=A0AAD0WEJ3_9GAMM|nr:ATP-dependent RNA helicase HrpA [Pseudoalteromonas donghaensis]